MIYILNVLNRRASIYVPLYLTIILPDTQKMVRPNDRKTAVISLTKTLADSASFVDRYQKGWAFTCEALLKLLEDPPLPTANEDLTLDQDVDDMSFGVGFTQLTTCKRVSRDQWPEITDVKRWVGGYLHEADARHAGRITQFIQARLTPEARTALQTYMQS